MGRQRHTDTEGRLQSFVGTVAFNPTQLITGNGGFWRADMGVTGSPNVTAWADQSSFANNLSVKGFQTSPTFSSTGFNTSFAGITVGSNSTKGMATASLNISSTTLSIFILMAYTTSFNGGRFSWVGNTSGVDTGAAGLVFYDSISSFQTFNNGTNYGNGGNPVSLTPGTLDLIGMVADGANINDWKNNVVQDGGSAFTASLGTAATLFGWGASSSTSSGFTCAFWGITEKALSSGDWGNLKTWSNSNWGTSF